MSFDTLPAISVQWDASTEDASDFLRYEVWRRVTGDTTWVKQARITNQATTSWLDYTAVDGVQYDYAVTQVIQTAGQEVASAFPAATQATLAVRSLFLHDVQSPEYYVEMKGQQRRPTYTQDIQLVPPRNASDPVAHVGMSLTRSMQQFWAMGVWNPPEDALGPAMWDALVMLQQRQRDTGSTLVMRTGTGLSGYCLIINLARWDAPDSFTVKMDLQRVYYDDTVP